MSKFVVAISVNKVQTFIYHVIKGNSADAETEDKTLKTIQLASQDISEKFKRVVYAVFGLKKEDTILFISGKAIFYSELSEDEILKRLKDIFKFYYYNYKGQVQIKYDYFTAVPDKDDKLEIVNKCTSNLKNVGCTNKIIEDNKELLFQFPEENYDEILENYLEIWNINKKIENDDEKNAVKKNGDERGEENLDFVYGLNEFVPDELKKNGDTDEDKKRYKIAIIKADIDGMGEIFKNQKDYKSYINISKILERRIDIGNLRKHLKDSGKWIKLLPFYIAGDDIFFAVSVSDIFNGVDIIKNMLDEINKEISDCVQGDLELTVSIGVDITQNHQPIRYYYERVEEQLKEAKKVGKLKDNVSLSICFDGIKSYIYKKDMEKSEINWDETWYQLRQNVLFLNDARKKGAELTTSYFYNLLELLQDEELNKNPILYTNAIFYRLLPSCTDDIKRINKMELVIKSLMMRKLTTEKKGNSEKKDNKPKYIIEINEDNKKRLENMVRLFLLFSDERYTADMGSNNELSDSDDKRLKHLLIDKIIVQSYVSPVLNFLYDKSLNKNLRDVFVKKSGYGKDTSVRRIKIEKSMFFKMKRVMESSESNKNAVKKIANMLANVNSVTPNIESNGDVQLNNNGTNEPETKSFWLEFDKDIFVKECIEDRFTKDYIDSLLLYYEYKKLYKLKRTDEGTKEVLKVQKGGKKRYGRKQR